MDVDKFNLDFDDDLAADAEQFSTHVFTQAGVDVSAVPQVVVPRGVHLPRDLEEAFYILREVYGETNSKSSETFCYFVSDVLAGGSNIQEAQELMQRLHIDKDAFSGRYRQAKIRQLEERVGPLHARWMAVWGAENITRAFMNYRRGQPYRLWLERALYRASLTEKDDRNMS